MELSRFFRQIINLFKKVLLLHNWKNKFTQTKWCSGATTVNNPSNLSKDSNAKSVHVKPLKKSLRTTTLRTSNPMSHNRVLNRPTNKVSQVNKETKEWRTFWETHLECNSCQGCHPWEEWAWCQRSSNSWEMTMLQFSFDIQLPDQSTVSFSSTANRTERLQSNNRNLMS